MSVLVRQELYKLVKKKSTFILFGAITLIMILMSVVTKMEPDIFGPENTFATAYAAFPWIVFVMIIQAGSIITMEFQYGTIKNLLYRGYSRTRVIMSKWLTLFIYSLILYVSTALIAIILKMIMTPDLSFSHTVNGDMGLMQLLWFSALGNFVALWLLISLVLLLSCVFRNTAVSIVIGIIFYFAASMFSGILFLVIEKWEWVKWNPLNMLNLSGQITNSETLATLTKLSLQEMFIGNIIYVIIFLFLVHVVFKRKSV